MIHLDLRVAENDILKKNVERYGFEVGMHRL